MPIYKETGFYEKLAASGKYIEKNGARFIDYKNDDEVYFGFQDGFNRQIPMAYEVERCEFDKDILEHSKSLGVSVYQPERVKDVTFSADKAILETNKGSYEAKFVIDTTGRDAFLGKKMEARKVNRDLNNVAVFAHYYNVERYPGKSEGDITIGLLPERAWTWIIPFQGDKTSVGVVCSSSVFKSGANISEYLEERLMGSPRVRQMMKRAERCSEVTVISNYSHTTETFVGDRWIMAGDAAVFLDPIFSSGVHVATQSGKFAAQAVIQALNEGTMLRHEQRGEEYERLVLKGVKRFHNFISMFYEGDFVNQMKKTATLKNVREGFTSAVAGDMWNDENFLFEKKIL